MMTNRWMRLVCALATAGVVLVGCDDGDGGGDSGPPMTDAGPGDAGPPAETCSDGLMNQDESDVDCGGVCGATCTPGEMCTDTGDCTTALCTMGTCDPLPTCDDGALNGTETDVDCGGTMCNPCDTGEMCMMGSDCVSEFCPSGTCEDTVCGDMMVQGAEDCDPGTGGTPVETVDCDLDCTSVMCGDGTANSTAGEECDGDGMGAGGETATCDTDCTAARCGDGVANATAGEACDGDGMGNGGETATCDTDCTAPMCGDLVVNRAAGEQCDDGNTVDTDLCSNSCTINGPSVMITADAVFNTDTGELDGTVSRGWDASTATLFVSDFTLASGATLSFTGSNAFRVESAGNVDIAGRIDADGEDGADGACNADGGAGGAGGPGGGAGGDGGRIGDMAPATIDGSPGVGSGAGQPGRVDEAGGGGAGHVTTGLPGVGDQATSMPGTGGAIYAALVSLEGGSGGGGGSADDDAPLGLDAGDDGGAGGGGGGGAVAFLAGGTITVTGRIRARGGNGGDGACDPNAGSGGGGSGGTIVLISSAGAPDVTGATLEVDGGAGGAFGPSGGDGADGELYVGAPPTCGDGVLNQDESGVDCGGTVCGACALGGGCRVDADCVDMTCTAGTCVSPQCRDAMQNGMETDVDCGGPDCAPCADGLACAADTDCAGSGCEAMVCVSCADGVLNDEESDVDCGGTECGACPAGRMCAAGTDCTAGVCLGTGTCDFVGDDCSNAFALTVGDNVVPWEARSNDFSTMLSCIPTFTSAVGPDVVMSYTAVGSGTLQYAIEKPVGQRWAVLVSSGACGTLTPEESCVSEFNLDALSGTFPVTMGTTYFFYVVDTASGDAPLSQPLNVSIVEIAPTCGDGILNGMETDVDCGGPATGTAACPARCAPTASCAVDTDCEIATCVGGACQPFTLIDDFEASTTFSGIWTTGGDAPFAVSTTMPIAGLNSAQAGTITDLQQSTLDLGVTCAGRGGVEFTYRVDSEDGFDFLVLLLDGVLIDPLAGWTGADTATVRFPIPAGAHTLQWAYIKDDIFSDGADTAWIDDVSLANCTAP